jgi:hypothetical protein
LAIYTKILATFRNFVPKRLHGKIVYAKKKEKQFFLGGGESREIKDDPNFHF